MPRCRQRSPLNVLLGVRQILRSTVTLLSTSSVDIAVQRTIHPLRLAIQSLARQPTGECAARPSGPAAASCAATSIHRNRQSHARAVPARFFLATNTNPIARFAISACRPIVLDGAMIGRNLIGAPRLVTQRMLVPRESLVPGVPRKNRHARPRRTGGYLKLDGEIRESRRSKSRAGRSSSLHCRGRGN